MKYVLQIAPIGGYRNYGVRQFEINGIEVKPTMHHGYKVALAIAPDIANAVLRRAIYQWLYDQVCDKDGLGLEIGVDYGDGLTMILEYNQPKMVIGVDPWLSLDWDPWFKQGQEHMDARYELVVKRFATNENVMVVRATSDDFFKESVEGEIYDWIHIDGDHREEPAYRDIMNSYRQLKVGGVLIIDDVHLRSWTGSTKPAVDRALAEIGEGKMEPVNLDCDPVAYRKVG